MDTETEKNISSNLASLGIIEDSPLEENFIKFSLAENGKYLHHCERTFPTSNNGKFQIPFQVPTENLMRKIIQQVEFLFSDANLAKDKFLLKHIRRNKEGYVSLKLISSLRKVKALTKDWRVVAYSLQKSEKLQINDEKTKIKRSEPLKVFEDLDTARTVLVFHMIPTCCTSESMKNILNKLGTVTSISIINSKTENMHWLVKKNIKHRKISTFPFAVVQFETPDEVANAILQTTHPSSILKILPLALEDDDNARSAETSSKDDKELTFDEDETSQNSEEDIKPEINSVTASENRKLSKLKDQTQKVKNYIGLAGKTQVSNSLQDKGERMLSCGFRGDGFNNRRTVQRKPYFEQRKEKRVIALRNPKGPDGTNGFQVRRVNLGVVTA